MRREVDPYNLLQPSTTHRLFDISKHLQYCVKNKQAELNNIKNRLRIQYCFDEARYDREVRIAENAF